MTLILTAAQPSRAGGLSEVVTRLKAHQRSAPVIRLAGIGVVACSILLPVLDLARIAARWTPSPGHTTAALVATACYLPMHVRHIWHAARGSRPAAAGWTLAAMAVVILGALPIIGTSWLIALPMLAVSVLIVVRPPWSLMVAAVLAAAPVPLTVAFGDPEWMPYYTASVIWQGASLFVLAWLTGATRQLQAARLALAEEAVARERLRIDGELQRTLGAALEMIVAAGQRTGGLVEQDPAAAGDALRTLVTSARETLAEARRMVTQYRDVSLRAELDAAATLLRAGGIQTRLVLPPGDLPEAVEPASRSALRAHVARLLRDGAARHCAIVVTRHDGGLRLEFRSDGAGSVMTTEVTVS